MLQLNPSAERASAPPRGSLGEICQRVAQGCGGQEQGRTCPSAGPGGSGEGGLGRGWQRGRGRAGMWLMLWATGAEWPGK